MKKLTLLSVVVAFALTGCLGSKLPTPGLFACDGPIMRAVTNSATQALCKAAHEAAKVEEKEDRAVRDAMDAKELRDTLATNAALKAASEARVAALNMSLVPIENAAQIPTPPPAARIGDILNNMSLVPAPEPASQPPTPPSVPK